MCNGIELQLVISTNNELSWLTSQSQTKLDFTRKKCENLNNYIGLTS